VLGTPGPVVPRQIVGTDKRAPAGLAGPGLDDSEVTPVLEGDLVVVGGGGAREAALLLRHDCHGVGQVV
jgi:hypothetical protein